MKAHSDITIGSKMPTVSTRLILTALVVSALLLVGALARETPGKRRAAKRQLSRPANPAY